MMTLLFYLMKSSFINPTIIQQEPFYKKGTKHEQIVNPYKIKINVTRSLTIKWKFKS